MPAALAHLQIADASGGGIFEPEKTGDRPTLLWFRNTSGVRPEAEGAGPLSATITGDIA